jgi:hypothetical protein
MNFRGFAIRKKGRDFQKPGVSPFIRGDGKAMHLLIAPAAALQLWRTIMGHSIKKLLVIVALTTALVAPAFAQQAPNARQDAQTARQQWSSRVHVYAPDYYESWHRNQNANPDFQLGYSR